MAAVLTAIGVERAKAEGGRRRELPDGALPGLYFVLQPSGARSWAVRYRHAGRPRKLTLGSYPAVDLVTARKSAREALQAVALGRDPGAEKVETRRKAKDAEYDQDLALGALDAFVDRHVKANTNARSARGTEHLFNLHVKPHWKGKRLDAIRRADIIELIDRVVDRGSPVAANRVLAAVRKFLNWTVDRGLIEVSPAARVKAPTEETSRDRVLSDAELRLAWLACEKIEQPFRSIVRLLILTAQRRDEVGKMTWGEVATDPALWTVPASRAKNGRANDVPLSAAALAVIEATPRIDCDEDFAFTTNGLTTFSGYSKLKARLDRAMLAIARDEAMAGGSNPKRVAIQPWRLHDLRRTVATGLARLGQPVHIIEGILNHTSGALSGVAGIYNRHRYLDEKRAALATWGQFVSDLVEDRPVSSVVPMAGRTV